MKEKQKDQNFENRVYGCSIVRTIDSNYNADFSGQPRMLNNGTSYATDKALKYPIKKYFEQIAKEKVFAMKSLKNDLRPRDLGERFVQLFKEFPKENDENGEQVISRSGIAKDLLTCIDLKLFGATFAGEENISIHGPVQINHARNIWHENRTYTEQIMSPYRNSGEDHKNDDASTLGRQANIEEGHYIHHFSINPSNLNDFKSLGGVLKADKEIKLLKEAMRMGVTLYSSSRKAGCDNELLFWVELQKESKLILPNFTELIEAKPQKEDGKIIFDFSNASNLLDKFNDNHIKKISIYADWRKVKVENWPANCNFYELFGEEDLDYIPPKEDKGEAE